MRGGLPKQHSIWAPGGPRLGPFGAHLGIMLGWCRSQTGSHIFDGHLTSLYQIHTFRNTFRNTFFCNVIVCVPSMSFVIFFAKLGLLSTFLWAQHHAGGLVRFGTAAF